MNPASRTIAVIALAAATASPSVSCSVFEDRVSLLNCGAIATATGTRRVRTETDCDENLRIEIQDVPRGLYAVLVDGVDRGTIHVKGRREGELQFDTSPKGDQLPLDFDPFGHVDIAVRSGPAILSLDQCAAP